MTLGLSNSMITDLIGFSDRTRRDYMKCKIINGKYTPKLLELLQISLHDWNNANDTDIPYSADDLLSLCKSIDSQADKTTIYNVTYKMKVANYIRSTEDKKYIKIPIAEKETVSLNDKVNDAIACIQKALSSYQSFNWLNCSESELLSTRQTFKALKKLSLNISDLF